MHRRLFLSTLAAAVAAPVAAKPKPALAAGTNAFPRALVVPGGVARIALGEAPERPMARSGDIPLLVVGSGRAWVALVGIPLAAGVLYPISPHLLLNPMIAAAAMSFSSVSVISNALRLRRVRLEP